MEMMLYKLAGSVILVAASIVYGRKKVLDERRKLRETEVLCDLVKHVGESIEHTLKPLPEIFRYYHNEVLEECGFLQEIRESGLRQAWESRSEGMTGVDDNVNQQFSVFCREIGRGYRNEEVELCNLTLKRLQDECARLRNDSKNKEKLYKTIPPLMAMSVALMLL